MANNRTILVDAQTVVLTSGGKLLSVALKDLGGALDGKSDVAVIPTESLRLVATSEVALHRQVTEKLPPGSVYCWELLQPSIYQVFIMPLTLMEALRACKLVENVVPYAVAVREGQKSALFSSTASQILGSSGLLTRAGRAFLGRETSQDTATSDPAKNDVAVIDIVAERPVLVVMRGAEVKAIRCLHAEADIVRELTLTLQGLGMPNCPVVTPNRNLAGKIREDGREAQVVRLPPDSPTIGLHGMRKALPVQFHLPKDFARIQRREVRRRQRRNLLLVGVVSVACVAAATMLTAARMVADRDLKKLRNELLQTTATHTRLFRERYARLLTGRVLDLPQAWAELEFMMTPQLEVTGVAMIGNRLTANLERRDQPLGQRDPPVTLADVRAAVEHSAMWAGSEVQILIVPGDKELAYSVVKRRENARR